MLEVNFRPGCFLRCLENWIPKASIFAGDFDSSLCGFAENNTKRPLFLQLDVHSLLLKDKSFDIIASLYVIEHLKKPGSFLKEVKRYLKKETILLLATANPSGILAIVLEEKWQGIEFDHISLKSPQEWMEILNMHRFETLIDCTTGLTGFKIMQKFPFALIN